MRLKCIVWFSLVWLKFVFKLSENCWFIYGLTQSRSDDGCHRRIVCVVWTHFSQVPNEGVNNLYLFVHRTAHEHALTMNSAFFPFFWHDFILKSVLDLRIEKNRRNFDKTLENSPNKRKKSSVNFGLTHLVRFGFPQNDKQFHKKEIRNPTSSIRSKKQIPWKTHLKIKRENENH